MRPRSLSPHGDSTMVTICRRKEGANKRALAQAFTKASKGLCSPLEFWICDPNDGWRSLMLNNPGVQAAIVAANFLILGGVLWNLTRVARKSQRHRPPPDSEFWEEYGLKVVRAAQGAALGFLLFC